MQVLSVGNVQMQTGNQNRKEWFLISKSDSVNTPLQHIQHYRKHMMPGLQGMWPNIWKTEKAEETQESKGLFLHIWWKRERMPPSPILFFLIFIGWLVWEGVCVFVGVFSQDHAYSHLLFTSLNTRKFLSTSSCFVNFHPNIFEKSESISITLSMAF